MSQFTDRELKKLKRLCRIECPPEEEKRLIQNLKKILDYISALQEIDTEGVGSCNYVLQNLQNSVMRDDTLEETLPREVFLSNTPAHVGGMVRVPPIINPST